MVDTGVIDLTNLEPQLTEDETIDLVSSLTASSSHPKKEIHLDLQPFWNHFNAVSHSLTFDASNEDILRATSHRFFALLAGICDSTEGTLSKIFFKIDSARPDDEDNMFFGVALVQMTLGWRFMKNVDEICFILPFFPIALVSASPDSDPVRKVSISRGSSFGGSSRSDWNVNDCTKFIEEIKKFTQGGLKELAFSSYRFPYEESLTEVVQEVERSRQTLKELSIYLFEAENPTNIFDLIAGCPSLLSLSLTLEMGKRGELHHVSLPEQAPSFNLNELTLELIGAELDWESNHALEWFGNNLECLKLILCRGDKLQIIPFRVLSTIFRLNPNLVILEIDNIDFSYSDFTENFDSYFDYKLHDLEELCIHNSGSAVLQLISAASFSSLTSLHVDGSRPFETARKVTVPRSSLLQLEDLFTILKAPQLPRLTDVFSDSTFGKITSLSLQTANDFGSDQSYGKQSLFIVRRVARSVESIHLFGLGEGSFQDAEEFAGDDFSFNNLKFLSLQVCNGGVIPSTYFISQFNQAGLSTLSINWEFNFNFSKPYLFIGWDLWNSIFALISGNSKSLKSLTIDRFFFPGSWLRGSEAQISCFNFTNLSSLRLPGTNVALIDFLSRCHLPKLVFLESDLDQDPSDLYRIDWIEERLTMNAPLLQDRYYPTATWGYDGADDEYESERMDSISNT